MPNIIYRPPDPIYQAVLDLTTAEQKRRYEAELARSKERARQKQTAIIVGSIVVGGALGAAAPAAGVSTTSAVISGASTGLKVGGAINQFAAGDTAGGIGTLANVASGVVQNLSDQDTFGYSPSKEERIFYKKEMLKLGISPKDAKAAAQQGITIPELVNRVSADKAGDTELQGLLEDFDIPMTVEDFHALRPEGQSNSQFLEALSQELQTRRMDQFAQKARTEIITKAQAENEVRVKSSAVEENYPADQLIQRRNDIDDIKDLMSTGQIPEAEGLRQIAEMPEIRPVLTKRKVPTNEELLETEVVSPTTGKVYIRDNRNGEHKLKPNGLARDGRTGMDALLDLDTGEMTEMLGKVLPALRIAGNDDPTVEDAMAAYLRAGLTAEQSREFLKGGGTPQQLLQALESGTFSTLSAGDGGPPPAGGPPPTPLQQGTPLTQGPVAQSIAVYKQFQQAAQQTPPSEWPPQMQQGLQAFSEKLMADMANSSFGDKRAAGKMLSDLADMLDEIEASKIRGGG